MDTPSAIFVNGSMRCGALLPITINQELEHASIIDIKSKHGSTAPRVRWSPLPHLISLSLGELKAKGWASSDLPADMMRKPSLEKFRRSPTPDCAGMRPLQRGFNFHETAVLPRRNPRNQPTTPSSF
jgi:hypothetical protein